MVQKMTVCLLCNKEDAGDSKDGIPVHAGCWYSWLYDVHKGDIPEAVKSLHDIQKQLDIIIARNERENGGLNR